MAVKTNQFDKQNLAQFLSRLCGGEVLNDTFAPDDVFLSRLCGGEGFLTFDYFEQRFLSRLCGGEEQAI